MLTRSTQPRVTGGLVGELTVAGRRLEVFSGRGALVLPGSRGKGPGVRRRPQRSLRTALPSAPALVDREAEMSAALGALEARLPLQFRGPPGIGKSALLNATLRRVSSRFGPVLLLRAGASPFSDLLQDLFDAHHEIDTPVKLTDAQLAQHLLNLHGLIGLDDVSLRREEVQVLVDSAPSCLFILVSEEDLFWGEGRTIPLSGVDEDAGLALIERGISRSLTGEERNDAKAVWLTLQGTPRHLIQAGTFARDTGVSLREVQERIEGSTPADTMAAAIAQSLSAPERRILSALLCLRRVAIGPELMAAVTEVAGAEAVLQSLVDRGMAEVDGPRYLAVESQGARTALDADWWAEFLFRHLTAWCEDNGDDHRRLLQNADALMWALAWGRAAAEWVSVIKLARNLEPALALGARWARWKAVLQAGEEAARALDDKAAQAGFLHQLGTRALCLDAKSEASALLTQSIQISEATDDDRLSSAGRQNLQVLREQRAPSSPARPEPRGGAHRRASRVALMVRIVAILLAFLIPIGVLVWRQGPSAAITPDPSSINFGARTVGKPFSQRLTLMNSGPKEVTIFSMAITPPLPDFSLGEDNCTGRALPGDEDCWLLVSFTPTATGERAATVAIRSDAEGSGLVRVQATGFGLPPGRGAALETQPSSLSFGIVPVGTSRTEEVRLVSTGPSPLKVERVSIDPLLTDYSLVHNCQRDLLQDQACTLTVTFQPTASGPRSTMLTLEDNAVGGLHQIPLLGRGSAPAGGPALELDKSSIDFGRQVVGETSQPQTVTLTSVGATPLNIENVVSPGTDDFAVVSSTCSGSMSPAAECTITVSFTPRAKGDRSDSLTIRHNMPASPTTVIPLVGEGSALSTQSGQPAVPGQPVVQIGPGSLDFGEVLDGSSATRTLEVTNVGAGQLEMDSVSLNLTGADFAHRLDCPSSIGPEESCSIHVTFTPSGSGSRSGDLSLSLNGQEQTVSLNGEGSPGVPAVTLDTPELDFGEVALGTSGQKVLTVTNSGQGPLMISATTDDPTIFSVDATSTCPGATVSSGLSCSFSVTFSPQIVGGVTATMQLFDNALEGPQQVTLVGTGVPTPTPAVGVEPGSLEWAVGESGEKAVDVSNTGTAPLEINNVYIAGAPAFSVNEAASTCWGATLSPGVACQITVAFTPPLGPGQETGNLTIAHNGDPAETIVSLAGTVE